jgi:hypothetical protein
MSICPIFSTFLAASKVDTEIDALVDEFVSQFQASDKHDRFSIGKPAWDDAKPDNFFHSYRYSTGHFALKRRGKRGAPRSSSLSLHFDLVRNVPEHTPKWPHARDALIVIAYDASGEGWKSDELCVGSIGRLEDADVWGKLKSFADKKILRWEGSVKTQDWHERAWIFAVPLRVIKSSDVVRQELVAPLMSLLSGGKPDDVLKNSQAISWVMTKDGELGGTEAS